MVETTGINLYNEYQLHDSLKRWAAGLDGRLEVSLHGRVADALRADGEIIEVQTRGLWAIQAKVAAWVDAGYRVRVIRPITVRRNILRYDAEGQLLSKRKSPKSESIWDLFEELVRTPLLIGRESVTLELVSVVVSEERLVLDTPVRRGRRLRDYRTLNRHLDEILASQELCGHHQWLALLPAELSPPWTTSQVGEALGIGTRRARLVLYTLYRAGLLSATSLADQRGRRYYYPLEA